MIFLCKMLALLSFFMLCNYLLKEIILLRRSTSFVKLPFKC